MKTQIKTLINLLLAISLLLSVGVLNAQKDKKEDGSLFSGLEFRSLGPAFTSGRIADIAIHPVNENIWYVAVGSGGVWKTENAGITWIPIFDNQNSFSIGCLAIDPKHPDTIWVGTGENVGGRHVGYGDGIYRSQDGGKTWVNMGLKKSEHLSKIIIHPDNPNKLWVAAQGPLWSSGGERGVYLTVDGGKTWKKTLGDDEWTGATDLLIDPNHPDLLYAATWDRHRTVAAYMGGGPGSGIHKSTDGGKTWKKLTNGIPKSNLGKIGLALSHFDSKTLYAAIELDRRSGGVFISTNQGESWEKQSDAVSGGTGPHYYQELYSSPHHDGLLFLMNNYVQISRDHGKSFEQMNEKNKHVDSHALAFKKNDPNYLLIGTDGGLYESFDHTAKWRHVGNLPITQYYKVAVDDSTPFYKIYGGTQDNGSHGGPSQTISRAGIVNADWWVTLFADGHQSAVEPGNPNITYGEFQQGVLWRIDQTTREAVYIQPRAGIDEPYERYNWDAPILVSPHNPQRLYFASQRVWRSDNRGDKWSPISKDLTKDQDRITLPIMGKVQSWDNAWDVYAMSNYNTITSLSESPLKEGLIYAGTDDGIIQITENGGESWQKIEVGSIKGIPETAFVNDIRADLFDEDVVYAALDNHKYGDYSPYLIKSTNKGEKWVSMNGNLPKNLITWRLVQDHIEKNLLFIATEFGIYTTLDGGKKWKKLSGGLPTISFRDLTIQRRENALVCASFGRGFYVLDDISPIREFMSAAPEKEATLFSIKPALWYIQTNELYGQGDSFFKAKNPPYGAIFNYYLKDQYKSRKELRQEREGKLKKAEKAVSFPGWETIEEETQEKAPKIYVVIKNAQGEVVNTVEGSNKEGFNTANWKLDYPDMAGVILDKPSQNFGTTLVTPGLFTAELFKSIDGQMIALSEAKNFEVLSIKNGALKSKSFETIERFRDEFQSFAQALKLLNTKLAKNLKRVDALEIALRRAHSPNASLFNRLEQVRKKLLDADKNLSGDKTKNIVGERSDPTPNDINYVMYNVLKNSTYGPTAHHQELLNTAKSRLDEVSMQFDTVHADLIQLSKDISNVGAPWVETLDGVCKTSEDFGY